MSSYLAVAAPVAAVVPPIWVDLVVIGILPHWFAALISHGLHRLSAALLALAAPVAAVGDLATTAAVPRLPQPG
ncbi:hypothetical protein B1T44_04755 [Mycobacterium persicum]|nr:hypothetical protein B1T44_04755 [Mycobacterium persicum]